MLIGFYGGTDAAKIIGKEGVIICIILFASPLSALRNVIMTKSAASIPLPFTLACLANCTAWSVVGWYIANDFNIYFPNILGLSCTIAQLLLKGIYGNMSDVGLPR
jgi:solute carrier family 50 protein (sugar transporter)